jgi:hypothetical protein
MNHPCLRQCFSRSCDQAVGALATIAALAATGVLALADLALTIDVARTHGLLEVNPVARALAEYAGAEGVVAWKLLTLSVGLWVLARCRHVRLARAAAIVALLAHCWMMGQWGHYMDAMRDAHSGTVAVDITGNQLAMSL